MPFTKLVDRHTCPLPKTREDASALVVGDEWQCDKKLKDNSGRKCGKLYRWSSDQREGLFWMPIGTAR
jgi:hypothetical protein